MTTKKPTQPDLISNLENQVENLTAALAKIATLTGYGNHLKEFDIDKWEPTKKDLTKKRD